MKKEIYDLDKCDDCSHNHKEERCVFFEDVKAIVKEKDAEIKRLKGNLELWKHNFKVAEKSYNKLKEENQKLKESLDEIKKIINFNTINIPINKIKKIIEEKKQ